MPTLILSTNVPVDAVVAADILKDCSKAVARIIGKPESVMHPACSTLCLFNCLLGFAASYLAPALDDAFQSAATDKLKSSICCSTSWCP